MPNPFPSIEWLHELHDKLNADQRYSKIASDWEGDLIFQIEPDDELPEPVVYYFDLWHGVCRGVRVLDDDEIISAAFTLRSPYRNWLRILEGELHPLQAMLTQKLRVQGSMSYMMRNVPTVMDFTRCAQEVTQGIN